MASARPESRPKRKKRLRAPPVSKIKVQTLLPNQSHDRARSSVFVSLVDAENDESFVDRFAVVFEENVSEFKSSHRARNRITVKRKMDKSLTDERQRAIDAFRAAKVSAAAEKKKIKK